MSDSIKMQQAQILQCYKQMDEIFHAYAVAQGLSDCAFWILYALCEAERPYTQNDLCEEWYYSKQTIHSAVTSLIKAGHVQLEHVPGSRNSKRITLTKEGLAYVDAHIRPLLDAEEKAFGRLSDDERQSYLQLVKTHIAFFSQEVETLKKQAPSSKDLSRQ